MSKELATTKDYLDQLFRVYPISEERNRTVNTQLWDSIQSNYRSKDFPNLIKNLLKLQKFPVKDAYVSFLREFESAVELNPNTVNRLAGSLVEIGEQELYKRCTAPKESNTQMGTSFSRWLYSGVIGCKQLESFTDFLDCTENCLLVGSDTKLKEFAMQHLGYHIDHKGLDMIAKFNGSYVVGEAKFITSEGGNQRNQIASAKKMLDDNKIKAYRIAIFDGVIYLPNKKKLLNLVCDNYTPHVVLSSLYLRDYLYSV